MCIRLSMSIAHRPKTTKVRLLLCLLVLLSATACRPIQEAPPASGYAASVALAWFNLSLKLVRETPGFSPPVAARAFGYLGVTLYQAVQPGMPDHRTLAGQLNELPALPVAQSGGYHWPLAANRALAVMMHRLFPTATPQNLAMVDALELHWANQFAAEIDLPYYEASIAWGETIAEAIYQWSLSDGGDAGYARNISADYVPPSGPGQWVSTPPAFAGALQPTWGRNRPFVLADGNACPAPPPVYSEAPDSAFYQDGLEVYQIVNALTAEEREIALFWADNAGQTATPAGHWISILNQILANGATLDVAAIAYAQVGIAVADAFIICWQTKYRYNVLRPITYIQAVIDPTWNVPAITDPLITPAFPEYTSGHSVQSAAAAAVLTHLFGANVTFTDHTHDTLGYSPRSFSSFAAAADDAARSRLYGGIHFRAAVEHGLAQGRCVAEQVLALRFAD